MLFGFEKTSRISLGFKLVPVQYRECEYGLLIREMDIILSACIVRTKFQRFLKWPDSDKMGPPKRHVKRLYFF